MLCFRLTRRPATLAACRSRRGTETGPRFSSEACRPTWPRQTYATSSLASEAWWRWWSCLTRRRRNPEVSWISILSSLQIYIHIYILWLPCCWAVHTLKLIMSSCETGLECLKSLHPPQDLWCMIVLTCPAAGPPPLPSLPRLSGHFGLLILAEDLVMAKQWLNSILLGLNAASCMNCDAHGHCFCGIHGTSCLYGSIFWFKCKITQHFGSHWWAENIDWCMGV